MPPKSWLHDLIQAHAQFESPLPFWKWAGLVSISAVVKDNVYLTQEMFNLYPNIYVMFHADSGLKKGPPVNLAKKLVQGVGNTKIISGRSSIQGILRKLGESKSVPGGKIKGGACGFICSSELSSSLVDDPAATDILTDLYDRSYNAGDWDSLLKGEEFALKDATVVMLSATNEAHSAEFLERKDVAGGFLARTFIIYESEENRPNSLIVKRDKRIDYEGFIEYLREIANLRGEFLPLAVETEDAHHPISKINDYTGVTEYYTPAGIAYEDWYTNFKKEVKGVKDSTGTLNRFGASVLKVAMLISLSKVPVLEITEDAMMEAIKTCETLVGNARKVTFGRAEGDPNDATRKKLMLLELMQRETHSITHAQLNKKFWMQGTTKEWEETAISLAHAEVIEIKPMGPNNVLYTMLPQAYEDLKSRFEGRTKVGQN